MARCASVAKFMTQSFPVPGQSSKKQATCAECGRSMRADNLKRHKCTEGGFAKAIERGPRFASKPAEGAEDLEL